MKMKIDHKILEKSKNKKDKIRLYMTKAMLGFQEHIIMMFEEKILSAIALRAPHTSPQVVLVRRRTRA